MNSKQFLTIGGAVLLLVGVLGMIGVIGPTPNQSIFKDFWWFDTPENVAHTVLGIAGLVAAFVFPPVWQKYLVIFLGVLGVVVGLYSLVAGSMFFGANLENPADTLLHFAVGGWALYSSLVGDKSSHG